MMETPTLTNCANCEHGQHGPVCHHFAGQGHTTEIVASGYCVNWLEIVNFDPKRNCGTCARVGCWTVSGAACDKWTSTTDPQVRKAHQQKTFYRDDVRRTAPTELSTPEYLSFAALGLGAEAGELLNAIKKHIHQGHPLDVHNVVEELGDVFFYMTALMDRLEVTLDEVIAVNMDKRAKRFPNGFDPQGSIGRGAGQ